MSMHIKKEWGLNKLTVKQGDGVVFTVAVLAPHMLWLENIEVKGTGQLFSLCRNLISLAVFAAANRVAFAYSPENKPVMRLCAKVQATVYHKTEDKIYAYFDVDKLPARYKIRLNQ